LTGITTSSDVWRRVQEVGAVFSEWPQLLLAYDVVWAALSLFVPLVILVACNVCLLRALRQSRQLQRRCRADVRQSTAADYARQRSNSSSTDQQQRITPTLGVTGSHRYRICTRRLKMHDQKMKDRASLPENAGPESEGPHCT